MKISIIIPIHKEDKDQIFKMKGMLMNQSKIPNEILFISEGTIPEARNIGVRKARNDYILQCDAGTIYPFDYVEKMCDGFKISEFVTARFYMYGDKYQQFFIRNNFGSSRCIGFTKRLWTIVKGYDEKLNWGEDTDFNQKVEEHNKLMITNAICFWKCRPNLKSLGLQFRRYGWGDKKSKRVKKLTYFIPILLFGEWIIYSFKLLRTIWTYRINYWRGII